MKKVIIKLVSVAFLGLALQANGGEVGEAKEPDIQTLETVIQLIKRVDHSSDDLSGEVVSVAMAARELAAAYGVSSIDPAVIALDASLNEQNRLRLKKGVSNER